MELQRKDQTCKSHHMEVVPIATTVSAFVLGSLPCRQFFCSCIVLLSVYDITRS